MVIKGCYKYTWGSDVATRLLLCCFCDSFLHRLPLIGLSFVVNVSMYMFP